MTRLVCLAAQTVSPGAFLRPKGGASQSTVLELQLKAKKMVRKCAVAPALARVPTKLGDTFFLST